MADYTRLVKEICHVCGGRLIRNESGLVCENCDTTYHEIEMEQSFSEIDGDICTAFLDLNSNSFNSAENKFNYITKKYPDVSDGYWGLVLAKYGIKYEIDYTGKKVPSCYKSSYESLYDNYDYQKAIEKATPTLRDSYEQQAKLIEHVRTKWIEIANNEKPYDIFISFKDKEKDNITPTDDSRKAQELYDKLIQENYRVFFAPVSLKNKSGLNYEPYIFNALQTSKVMILLGSKIEYIQSVWVMNEWNRFNKLIIDGKKQKGSLLVLCDCKTINPKELPTPLNNIQITDMSNDFFNDINKRIRELLKLESNNLPHIVRTEIKRQTVEEKTSFDTIKKRELKDNFITPSTIKIDTSNLERRTLAEYVIPEVRPDAKKYLDIARICLEDGGYVDAQEYYESALEYDPNNEEALFGQLMCIHEVKNRDELLSMDFSKWEDYEKIANIVRLTNPENAVKILDILANQCLKLLKNDAKKSYQLFDLIKSYDIKSIHDLYKNLIDEFISSNLTINDYYCSILEESIDYLGDDYNKYTSYLTSLIDYLIRNGYFDYGEHFFEKYRHVCKQSYYNYSNFLLRIKYKEKRLGSVIKRYVNENNIKKLDEIIAVLDIKSANKLLDNCSDVAKDYLFKKDYVNAYKIIQYLLEIDFDGRDSLIKEGINHCIDNANIDVEKIFDLLLKTFNESSKADFIRFLELFAGSAIRNGSFDVAKKYYLIINDYDSKNQTALYGIIFCNLYSREIQEYVYNINKFEDFNTFETLLSSCNTEQERNNVIDNQCNYCIDNLMEQSDGRVFSVFDKFITYYTKEYDDTLISCLKKMADLCLKKSLFDDAERYYAIICGLNGKLHWAYWGLLLSKLHCKNDEEAQKQERLLRDFQEYKNAIAFASDDIDALKNYTGCQIEQRRIIRYREIGSDGLEIEGDILKSVGTCTDKEVYIPRNIRVISGGAFSGCEHITNIYLQLDGELQEICSNAFGDCIGLTSIEIPSSVKKIDMGAFAGCSSLESISMPVVNQKLKSGFPQLFGKKPFKNSKKIICGWNDCYYIPISLKKVVITGGEITKDMFYNCDGIKEIILLNGIKKIGDGAFSCCNVPVLTIPKSVKEIGEYAFERCCQIVFEEGSELNSIGAYAFSGCRMSEITIPSGVKYIGKGAFNNCHALEKIIIPNSVIKMGQIIENQNKFTGELFYDGTMEEWCKMEFENDIISKKYELDHDSPTLYINNEKICDKVSLNSDIKIINDYSLSSISLFEGISSFIIPKSVQNLGIQEYDKKIESIFYSGTIEEWCKINNINKIALLDDGLSVIINNKDIKGFLIIPDNLTTINYKIGYDNRPMGIYYMGNISMWCKLQGLRKIMNSYSSDIPLYIGGILIKEKLVLDNSVEIINNSAFAFRKCLTEVVLNNGVTQIEPFAFHWCSELKNITISSSVQQIGDNAFAECVSLEKIIFEEKNFYKKIRLRNIFSSCPNIDILVNGEKEVPFYKDLYIKDIKNNIKFAKENGVRLLFGKYQQTTDGKIVPIEWDILSGADDEMLIISHFIIDMRRFDEKTNDYLKSELREWLNNEFYNESFDDAEKKIITESKSYDLDKDKVFLLSSKEIQRYFPLKFTRITVNKNTISCSWWLRSPKKNQLWSNKEEAQFVCEDEVYGLDVDIVTGVRPAMWIKL